MSRMTESTRARAEAHRRVGAARAVLVGTALFGSLGLAGALTAQAVATVPGNGTSADGTTGQSGGSSGQASDLVAPSHGHRTHATTKGS